MQRICFWKTVSLFNHILQPSQALALFYQSLIFASKNVSLIKWISFHIDIPNGLQLFMIDIKGNVTIDEQLFVQQSASTKHNPEGNKQTTRILKWLSRLILRLITDCSVSSKLNRSIEFENFNEFFKQFHTTCVDDLSIVSNDENDDDDDLDEDNLIRRAIHRALIKSIDYIRMNTFNYPDSCEIQNFENNSIALYNQQIIQILCCDTLELEIELIHQSRQSSFDLSSENFTNDQTLITYYSIWATLWKNVMIEYLQFNCEKSLRKVTSKQISTSDESNFDDEYEIISPIQTNTFQFEPQSTENLLQMSFNTILNRT